MLENIQELQ